MEIPRLLYYIYKTFHLIICTNKEKCVILHSQTYALIVKWI